MAILGGLGGRMQFSPLESEIAPGERDHNARNLAAIDALDLGSDFRFAFLSDSHDDVDGLLFIGDA